DDCDKLVKAEFDNILGMSSDNLSLIEIRAFFSNMVDQMLLKFLLWIYFQRSKVT
ncbi:20308_t:CDS:1, partial [Gigaspora rosea]